MAFGSSKSLLQTITSYQTTLESSKIAENRRKSVTMHHFIKLGLTLAQIDPETKS